MSIFADVSQYMPHGMCLLWQPWLVVLWAGSDVLIVAAYFAIPFALLRVLVKRDDIRHRGLILLFASFIMLCGVTHALSVVTLWFPIYPFQGVVKLITGLVSATTAVVLFRLVPTLVAIPSSQDLETANRELKREIAAHKATMRDLEQARRDLEAKVEERTAELRQVNSKLAVTAREAVHRSHNLITVVSAMARQSARSATSVAAFADAFTGRLTALAEATAAVIRGTDRSSARLGDVVRKQLEPVMLTYPDRVDVDGPVLAIGAEAAQQFSLAVHELATNAQKYGALDGPDSRIAVSWTIAPAGDAAELRFRWVERIDAAAPPEERDAAAGGFGTQLLTRIIPSMLNGDAQRTLSDGNLRYELRVPLEAIVPDEDRKGAESFVADLVDGDFATP